jgi:WD repeat-containing protein 1 (actin-interacting protein 1)
MKRIEIKNAVPGGANAVLWIEESKLAGSGADACVKMWEINFHV